MSDFVNQYESHERELAEAVVKLYEELEVKVRAEVKELMSGTEDGITESEINDIVKARIWEQGKEVIASL